MHVNRRRNDESGFTIMEVIVAMIVIGGALLGLLTVQVRSLSTIQLAKERQTASALASRAMEQLRALPYTAIQGGLSCADLTSTTDTNLTVTGSASSCTATFTPVGQTAVSGETVVVTSGTPVAPLSPHVSADVTVNGATYRIRNYVTKASTTSDAGYWLSVTARWTSGNTKGTAKRILLRSLAYSPTGCLSTSTHPFSGPCQSFFYTNAGVVPGVLSVDSTRAGLPIVDGLAATSASVTPWLLSTRTEDEQIVASESRMRTSLVTMVDSTTTTAGGAVAASSSDTDPATGVINKPTAATSATQAASASLSSTGSGAVLTAAAAASDAGSALSTSASAASPACYDNTGSSVANAQNCSSASATPGGTNSLTLSLNGRTLTLGSMAAASTTARAFGGRFASPMASPAHCASTSGVGCVSAGSSRSRGTITAGSLPSTSGSEKITNASGTDVTSAFASAGSVFQLTSYSDSATAESGVSPTAAAFARTGTMKYWNGTGLSTVTLNATTSGTWTIPTTTGTFASSTIVLSGSVVVTPGKNVTAGSSDCLASTCTSKTDTGTIVLHLNYTVYSGATVVGAFSVTVDAGQAVAQTSYKAAPSA